MKKFLIVLLAIFLFGCDLETEGKRANREAQNASMQAQVAAQASISVPDISYFQERRTIAKWAKHWDRPSAACYVYLISFGNIIGYYISDGKPASNRSYITPVEQIYRSSGGSFQFTMEAPDIDGCYGDNNQGIRFFTASGIAVEWGGDGASYLYSDAPLKINVPLLGN